MKQIRDKWAVVTGAASGIGRAIALRLAREGTHLWLVDRQADDLRAVADEVRRCGVAAREMVVDLGRTEQVEGLADDLVKSGEPLDILVNNAGVAYYGATLSMPDDAWDQVIAVNLQAPLLLTRRLLPLLLDRPEAHVVNIASILGIVAHRKACAYHVTKFGMVGFSEALRAEFGPRGLGVTAVCPGFVSTNLFRQGMVGPQAAHFRKPPQWLCTTPERVADRTVRAICRNKRLVVVTPLAHALHYLKRLAPGFLDWLQQLERFRLLRKKHKLPKPFKTSEVDTVPG